MFEKKTGVRNSMSGTIVSMKYEISREKAPNAESSQVKPNKNAMNVTIQNGRSKTVQCNVPVITNWNVSIRALPMPAYTLARNVEMTGSSSIGNIVCLM